jgi:hypothetical protein
VSEALPVLSGSGRDRFFMARAPGASRILQFVPDAAVHEPLFSWQPRDVRFEWLSSDAATKAGIMPLRLASSVAVGGQTFLVLGYDPMNLAGSRWLSDMLTPAAPAEMSLDDFLLMAKACCGALDYLSSDGRSLVHCNVRPSAILFLPELTTGEGRFRLFRTSVAYRMDSILTVEQAYYQAICDAKKIDFGDHLWKNYTSKDDSKCLYRLLSAALRLVADPEREYEQLLQAINQGLRNRSGNQGHKDLAFQKEERLKIVNEIKQIDASARTMVQRTQGVAIRESVRHIGKLMECKERLKEILKDGKIPNELVIGILKGAFPDYDAPRPPALESVEPAEICDQQEPTRVVVRGQNLLGVANRFLMRLQEEYVRPAPPAEESTGDNEDVSLAQAVLLDDMEDADQAPTGDQVEPVQSPAAASEWQLQTDPDYVAKKDAVGLIVPLLKPGRYKLSADGSANGLEIDIRETWVKVPTVKAVKPKALDDVTRSETVELVGIDLDALGELTLLDATGAPVADPLTGSRIVLSRPVGADEDGATRAYRTVPALQREGSFELAHDGRPTGVSLQARAQPQQFEQLSPDAVQNDSPRTVEVVGRQLRFGAAYSLVAADNSAATTVDGQPVALECANYAADRIALTVPDRVVPGTYRVLCAGQETKLGLVVDPAVVGFEPKQVCLRNAVGRRRRNIRIRVVGRHFEAGAGTWALVGGNQTHDVGAGTAAQSPVLQLPAGLVPGTYRLRIGEREFAPALRVKTLGAGFQSLAAVVVLVLLTAVWSTIAAIKNQPAYDSLEPTRIAVHSSGNVLEAGTPLAIVGKRLDPGLAYHVSDGSRSYDLTVTDRKEPASSSIWGSGSGYFDRLELTGCPASLPATVTALALDKGDGLRIAIDRVALDSRVTLQGDAIEKDGWTPKGKGLTAVIAGRGLGYLKEHGTLVLQERSGVSESEPWSDRSTELGDRLTVGADGTAGQVSLADFVPPEGQRGASVKWRLLARWSQDTAEDLPAFEIRGLIRFAGVCEAIETQPQPSLTTYRKSFYLVFSSGEDSLGQLEFALQLPQGYEALEPGERGPAEASFGSKAVKLAWSNAVAGPMRVVWRQRGTDKDSHWNDPELVVDARPYPEFNQWKLDGATTRDQHQVDLSIEDEAGVLDHALSIGGNNLGTVERLSLVAAAPAGGRRLPDLLLYQQSTAPRVPTDSIELDPQGLQNAALLAADTWVLRWRSTLPATNDGETGLRIKVHDETVIRKLRTLIASADDNFATPTGSATREDPETRTNKAVESAKAALNIWADAANRSKLGDALQWGKARDRMRFYVFFDLAFYKGKWASAFAQTFETPYYQSVKDVLGGNTWWILANREGSPDVTLRDKDPQAAWVDVFAIAWQSYLNLLERNPNKQPTVAEVAGVTQALLRSHQAGESRVAPALLALMQRQSTTAVVPTRPETVFAAARERLAQSAVDPAELDAQMQQLESHPLFYLMLLLAVDKSANNSRIRIDLRGYDAASREFPQQLEGLMHSVKRSRERGSE